MIFDKTVIFLTLMSDDSKLFTDSSVILWSHEKRIRRLIIDQFCIIDDKTQNITRWKGPLTYILKKKTKLISTDSPHHIINLEDIHQIAKNKIYIIGNSKLYDKFIDVVDEMQMFYFQKEKGN